MSDANYATTSRKLRKLERSLRAFGVAGLCLAAMSCLTALLLEDLTLGLAAGFIAVGSLGGFALAGRARRVVAATHHADQALVASREREQKALAAGAATVAEYRFLVESIPQLVWTARSDGAVDYCNQSWTGYTGLSMEELCASGWDTIVHDDDKEQCFARWEQSLRSGDPYEVMCRLRGVRDGKYRWFLSRAVPLRDKGGHIVKWFGTCTDIDDQQRFSEQLAEADQRKDEFLAMLGHELRNPLAPILTAVQLSRLKEEDPRASQRQREIIERQVRHMVRLVDDLLDVSRITRGKIQLHKETVDVTHVVARAVEAASTLIERRGHGLSIQLPRGSLKIQADPVRIEQVLLNLLQNAAKYTEPDGDISLAVHALGDEIEIRVRDSGIGISPECLERVFRPFEQVNANRGASRGGIGVGLALVKGLVELHGGTVSARSDGLGQGSEFVVRLPGLLASESYDEGLATVTPFPSLAPAKAKKRVLVVDDNVDAADSLGEALQGQGYEVRVVYDGATALRMAEEFTPSAVLLDLGLPEIDGLEVGRRLRGMPEHASTLIVALTGYGQERDVKRTRAAGFDEHLVKPVDLEVLFDVIRRRFVGVAAASA